MESKVSANAVVILRTPAPVEVSEFERDPKGLKTCAALMFLILLWCASILVVNPTGKFPLNDDWQYSVTAFNLAEFGTIKLSSWAQPSLIGQAVWGAFFCKCFGTSYEALRASTVLLGMIGSIAAFALTRFYGASIFASTFCAAMLAFNPVYLSLSCTFMTDVPFLCVGLFTMLCFARALRSSHYSWICVATAGSVVAVLIRQYGLLFPVSFAVATLLQKDLSWRVRIMRSVLPVAMTFTALWGYEHWLLVTGNVPAMHPNARLADITASMVQRLAHPIQFIKPRLTTEFMHLGLFLFPFTLAMLVTTRRIALRSKVLMLAASLLLTAWCYHAGHLMPWWDNILSSRGIGPFTLRDVFILHLPNLPVCSTPILVFGTWISIISSIAFVSILVILSATTSNRFRMLLKPEAALWSLFFAAYSCAIILQDWEFERYFLPMMISCLPAIALTVRSPSVSMKVLASAFLIPVLLVSILGTRDYFEWNRARWRAANYLMNERHVPPSKIDGGFEFNGLHTFADHYRQQEGKSWWWVQDNDFILSFGPVPNYETIYRSGWHSSLFAKDNAILVEHKRFPQCP